MLEKPDIDQGELEARLQLDYGLSANKIEFLPVGADYDSVVYRLVSTTGSQYYVKLRKGKLSDATLMVPVLLRKQGVDQVIPPIQTKAGDYLVPMGGFNLAVYPFVSGQNGVEARLGREEWVAFGRALRVLHELDLPGELAATIPVEGYEEQYRRLVTSFQAQAERHHFDDSVAESLAGLLREQRELINWLVYRAGQLAEVLQRRSLPLVLCHGDIHAYNLLIEPSGHFYLVDWDTLILAPKERDLMFLGAGIGGSLDDPLMEPLFYEGYGATAVDTVVLVYYRYQRIIEDIAAYCQHILNNHDRQAAHQEGLRQLESQFHPGDVVDVALKSERMLPEKHRGTSRFT